jgi:hypothetical protein
MRAIVIFLALAIAGAAYAKGGHDIDKDSDPEGARIVARAHAIMPVPVQSIKKLSSPGDTYRAYIITFDLSEIPGAPPTISSGIETRAGDTWETVSKALDVIAADLVRIIDNVKAGKAWNEGLPSPRPLRGPQ